MSQGTPCSTQLIFCETQKEKLQAEIESLQTQLIADESRNPWKRALIDELVVDCILSKEHYEDPKKALQDAIMWNIQVALDPSVSSEMRDHDRAVRRAALLSAAERIDECSFGDMGELLRRMAEGEA